MGLNEASAAGRVIALAGNPNTGKSTLFNRLTGMHQHTGNWSGKTVAEARGVCSFGGRQYQLIDTPGSYSLSARSAEEEVARDLLCSGTADAVVVVCAACCLARGLTLAVQLFDVTDRVVVCVNLMDEAAAKGIDIDLDALAGRLGVPVVGTSARSGSGTQELMAAVEGVISGSIKTSPVQAAFSPPVESAVRWLEASLRGRIPASRFAAAQLLCGEDTPLCRQAMQLPETARRLNEARQRLTAQQISQPGLHDSIASAAVRWASKAGGQCLSGKGSSYGRTDRLLDRILTGRYTALPVMLIMLTAVLWITLVGANYPSEMLSQMFDWLLDKSWQLLRHAGCPEPVTQMLVGGVLRIVGWVVSVMLPPMAIFFPLFTLLEDSGFLPRLAFNMDSSFKRCGACGKQALTIAMGFGCNAAGVTGCRIIDSPRERLIAVLTNSLVPCNGRFPMMAAVITMFLTARLSGAAASAASSLILAAAVVLGIAATFGVSRLLSSTLLRGVPSAFVLELPPYRKPQWGRVIVRSVLDRTLFVLGRAVITAAPAGLVLWIMANVRLDGGTLLQICSSALDAPGRLMGLDGAVLLAFILGFPANEVVVPILLMIYTSQSQLSDPGELGQIYALLSENGWTWVTGVCMLLFSLLHWPCSTTCLTVYRETGSLRWTLLAILIPTALGFAACTAFNLLAGIFALG